MPLGGIWHRYEYAVYNRDNHGGAAQIRIPVCSSANLLNKADLDPGGAVVSNRSTCPTAVPDPSLTFGTMYLQNFDLAWLQLTYAIAFFLLLAARSWNVISLDHMLFGKRATSVE